jgi:hypothetical protein
VNVADRVDCKRGLLTSADAPKREFELMKVAIDTAAGAAFAAG